MIIKKDNKQTEENEINKELTINEAIIDNELTQKLDILDKICTRLPIQFQTNIKKYGDTNTQVFDQFGFSTYNVILAQDFNHLKFACEKYNRTDMKQYLNDLILHACEALVTLECDEQNNKVMKVGI